MRVQKAIEINAPPKRIWPFFIEPEKVLQWCITFKRFEYTSNQRSGVGTPFYIEEQAGGPLMKMHFKITECKENEKLALRMVSGTGVESYEQSWSLETIPSGSRFTFREEIELPLGVIGKLLGFILERVSAATVDKMLVKLKTLAEA
ncbi:MAG: SRPBCC family protein [Anaerolineae bacterium]